MIDFGSRHTITPSTLWRYLEKLGWEKKFGKEGRIVRFSLKQLSEPVHIFFTLQGSEETVNSEMATAMSTLNQIYGYTVSEVVQASTSLLSDLIKATIPDAYVQNNTINLKTATTFIKSIRDFLASAATAEGSTQRNFPRNSSAALAYVNGCRFGHTFKSSFGFTIESPVEPNDEIVMPFIDAEVPHGRKVVNRISNSFEFIRKAKLQDSIAPIVDPESGISSNMCDDLIAIVENTGIHKIKFSFELSPEWNSHSQTVTEVPFQVEVRDLEMLRDASSRIRGTTQPVEAVVMGMVSRLETSGNRTDIFDDDATREVIINWESIIHGRIKVKVPLNPAQYRVAIDAHATGKPYLASGLLKKEGRSWALVNVNEARVMN